MNKIYLLILILSCIISAIAQVFLKKATKKQYASFFHQYFNLYVIIGYSLFCLIMIVNIWLLKFIPMSIVSLFGESFPLILSQITGKLFFKETITYRSVIGIVCIVIGLIIVLL